MLLARSSTGGISNLFELLLRAERLNRDAAEVENGVAVKPRAVKFDC